MRYFKLEKLRSNKVASLKAAKLLTHVVLLLDEMYLQKCAQHTGSEYVGADLDGNLCNLFSHKFS